MRCTRSQTAEVVRGVNDRLTYATSTRLALADLTTWTWHLSRRYIHLCVCFVGDNLFLTWNCTVLRDTFSNLYLYKMIINSKNSTQQNWKIRLEGSIAQMFTCTFVTEFGWFQWWNRAGECQVCPDFGGSLSQALIVSRGTSASISHIDIAHSHTPWHD